MMKYRVCQKLRIAGITLLLSSLCLGSARLGAQEEQNLDAPAPTAGEGDEEGEGESARLGPDAFENILLPTAWKFTQAVMDGDWETAQPHYLVPPVIESEPHPLAAEVQEVFSERHRHHGSEPGGFQIFEAQSVQVLGFQGGWVVPILWTGPQGLTISYDLWVNSRNGWKVLPMRVVGRDNVLVSLPGALVTEELLPTEQRKELGESLERLQEEGTDLGRWLMDQLDRLNQPN